MCWLTRSFGFIKGNITSVPRLLLITLSSALVNSIQGCISKVWEPNGLRITHHRDLVSLVLGGALVFPRSPASRAGMEVTEIASNDSVPANRSSPIWDLQGSKCVS